MSEIKTFSNGDDVLGDDRLVSLDVFRGIVLFFLVLAAANGNWASHLAESNPDSWRAQYIGLQFTHLPWEGASFWDLIQPAFMFIVGVAVPFSYLKRTRRGERYSDLLTHALIRALILILLGVFLRSINSESTNWTFVDVLTQIGLGYFALFLMWRKWWRVQAATAFTVLFLYWLLFVIWQVPPETFDWSIAEGQGWTEPLTGFSAHWNKNTNPAHGFDVWFLNGLPRPEPFIANAGGYATLNFIPSFATMLIGLMIGEYVQNENRTWAVPKFLLFLGMMGLILGIALDMTGISPMVKRIWTPSFVLYSAGWCTITLAILYGWVELYGKFDGFLKPFVFLGVNSIAIYVMCWLVAPWLNSMLKIHLGENFAGFLGDGLKPLVENVITMILIWLIAWWMYRRRIFLRI